MPQSSAGSSQVHRSNVVVVVPLSSSSYVKVRSGVCGGGEEVGRGGITLHIWL